MRDRLTQALKAQDVEYADIRIEDSTASWVNFSGPDLDSIGSSRTVGGIVRALYKGGWGYATFNDLEGLDRRVQEACESARLVGKERTLLAEIEPVVDVIKAPMGADGGKDFRAVSLAEKKALAEEYNQIILGHHKSIQTSSVRYGDSFKTIWYANSQGTYIQEEQPDLYMFMMAIARQGDIVQTAYETGGGLEGYQTAEHLHDKATMAATRAVELTAAPTVTGGKYTVIADPLLTGVFAHEAFGHLSESDFVYENEHMKDLMQLGKRFGVEGLNIIDDGSLPGGLGTHPYDYEGTPTHTNYLIREGILVGRLHSRETAAKMGEQPTGNARAVAFQHPPIVRMTNTYIDQGESNLEDMLKDIKLGVMAVNAIGGMTAIEMFTFSAGYGYMIRDGAVAELVRDVVLSGNVFETLLNIDAIGDQVVWNPISPGGCGKGNQYPLRVGTGGPYVRIQNCMIGGQQ
jgi:TldD protein